MPGRVPRVAQQYRATRPKNGQVIVFSRFFNEHLTGVVSLGPTGENKTGLVQQAPDVSSIISSEKNRIPSSYQAMRSMRRPILKPSWPRCRSFWRK